MLEVAVIDDPAVAEVSLDPVRARLLAALAEPGSASTLAAVAPDPGRSPDQLSARWLLALAARLVREVGDLIGGATAARQRLATFGIDSQVRFASAGDRAAFAEELAGAVTALVGKYHDETAEGGRQHRLVVALHPSITRGPQRTAAAPGPGDTGT